MQISIDGPAGAGKSSVSKALAEALGFIHIDTGAMYRALTWLALRRGIDPGDGDALSRLARAADISFAIAPVASAPGEKETSRQAVQQVYCAGENVTAAIRGLPVSGAVSAVAAVAGVREAMVEAQRRMAADRDVVMDGRDIGTVVLPHAECKIFLTADPRERARRRKREREGAGREQSIEEIAAEIRKRDAEDSGRENSPLRQAEDSVLIDTTFMSFREVVEKALSLVRARQKN